MKKGIFIFMLFTLSIPWLQDQLNIFSIKPLYGVATLTDKPTINFKHWWDGNFQTEYSKYENEFFGIRTFFIRIFNQFDFSLFDKTHAEVVVGQNGYLFQDGYINEITGSNYIGEEAMQLNIKNIQKVENYLRKKNIFLLTVLAPGKTDYYKEYLPHFSQKLISTTRNYSLFLKYSKIENIHFIDFNNWFLQLKNTSQYPLFPKQGIHWSSYGMFLAADSIIKYIEAKNKIRLSNISCTWELSETLQGADYDLGELLNIYQQLPYDKMVYPKFKIKHDSIAAHPRLLVIGDSFYWTIYNEGIYKKVFNNETFYYYNSMVNPKGILPSDNVSDLNFLKEVEKYDVIILLQSSANYGNPGVNFIQSLQKELSRYDIYFKKEKNRILNDESLRNYSSQLAGKLNISQDSAISLLSDSLTHDCLAIISQTKIQMRHNPEWMKSLNEKSQEQNKSVEEMMQSDAEWMLEQKNR